MQLDVQNRADYTNTKYCFWVGWIPISRLFVHFSRYLWG